MDVLVNNAGVMATPRRLSPQGHESQFAGNHLGHFALTGLLLGLPQAGSDPRVVTVTSMGHHGGQIFFDDLALVRRLRRRTSVDFDPHWWRHTYATRLLREGTPVDVVSSVAPSVRPLRCRFSWTSPVSVHWRPTSG
ncbi:hypothetical protein [Streptomyces ipomoeae]|uniref:hypothetical protein n=1 Tax=Streptomyces ipomoeae TaxID=103232 RepID=UPI0038D50C82